MSGAGNGGLTSAGRYESHDAIGALQHVRGRAALSDMDIALFSRCNNTDATPFAMATQPAFFDDVRCLIACQPPSVRPATVRNLQSRGPEERIDQLEHECRLVVSLTFDQMSPIPWGARVHTPTSVHQVHDGVRTFSEDVQAVYDALDGKERLHWIEGTTSRWDGYLEFQRRPEPVLAWLDEHTA